MISYSKSLDICWYILLKDMLGVIIFILVPVQAISGIVLADIFLDLRCVL